MRALLPILLLAGCATVPPETMVVGRAEPVKVLVPIVVPCIDPSQIEPLPPSVMPDRNAGVAELASGAAADLLRYHELAQRQADQLRICASKPQGGPAP